MTTSNTPSSLPILARKIQRSKEQWQQIIDQYQASGLTQIAFCKQSAIPISSFCRWKSRLKPSSITDRAASESDTFIPVTPLAAAEHGHWRIELDLGDGQVLRIR